MKLKDTLVGADDKLSWRRVTAFVYVVTDLILIFFNRVNSEITLHLHYSLLVFVLIMAGIVTGQNIIDFKNGKNNNSNTDSNTIQ